MIYSILSKLFSGQDFDTRYNAKPTHLIYPLLIMAMGTRTLFYDGWAWFGVTSFLLGFLLGLSIIICMNWDRVIEYWDTINEHIKLMTKSNNPDLWYALGYKQVPQTIEVIEKQDKGGGSFTWKMSQQKISPSKMNEVANKVLGTGSLEFTEEKYGKLIPNFRQFRKDWIADGKLVQKNKKNPKLGYVLSKKGLQVIYQFASENMKLKENEVK